MTGGRSIAALAAAAALACGAAGCGSRKPIPAPVPATTPTAGARAGTSGARGAVQEGLASWYGRKFHGRVTASGERYDMDRLTAAHRTLPFGTRVEVRNLRNGRSVVVRINDRGPFVAGRVIDLSRAAARALDMIEAGVVPVRLRVLR